MPNAHNRQENGAGGAPADHFAHSRRRIEDDEVTLDTIAGRCSEHGNAGSEQERVALSYWFGAATAGALTDADFRGCRWIEGEPKPLRRGMFCGRPVLAGESWCARHRLVVFGEEVKGVRHLHRRP